MTENNIKDCLSMNIKTLREKKKMTQEQLSAKSGIHRVSLTRYETGRQTPSIYVLHLIAIALDVKLGKLFENCFK